MLLSISKSTIKRVNSLKNKNKTEDNTIEDNTAETDVKNS